MLKQYKNGNALISIDYDGSREIEYENTLNLDFPLNIDIRVSTQCSFANNICKDFCHESAKIDGIECDYSELKKKLEGLPKGIELAIGCNNFTDGLWDFLYWCKFQEYICNITINQGHIRRDLHKICSAIDHDLIKGLGISFRSKLKFDVPETILNYSNTVFHVISGINTFNEVENLCNLGVSKILILGEKDFGYNSGKVDLSNKIHKEWFWWVHKLFDKFKVVSFDNLALEQLKIKRFFLENHWNTFNQGEYSFYIDAVSKTFSPSSRNPKKENWNNHTISSYFKELTINNL